ncbi:MAG: hypothetical protein ABR592_02005 [Nitriliruptorales bacterium]
MPKRSAIAAAVVVLVLGGTVLGASAASDGDPDTFVLYSRHDPEACTLVDLGEKGFGPGDQFTCVEEVTDAEGEKVGLAYLSGIQITQDVTRLDVTFSLPKGEILISDVETDAEREAAEDGEPLVLAVMSGTSSAARAPWPEIGRASSV